MSDTEIMEGLCGIIATQSRIIAEQDAVLRQYGAVACADERAAVRDEIARLEGDTWGSEQDR